MLRWLYVYDAPFGLFTLYIEYKEREKRGREQATAQASERASVYEWETESSRVDSSQYKQEKLDEDILFVSGGI